MALDDRAGSAAVDHVKSCPSCQERLEEMRRDAAFAGGLLGVDSLGLEGRTMPEGAVRRQTGSLWRTGRVRAGSIAAAAAVVVAVLAFTPVGSFAAGLLTIFEPQSLVGVVVPSGEGQQILSTLNNLGTVEGSLKPAASPVASAQAAAQSAGFTAEVPSYLPPGVSGQPSYVLVAARTVTFTFSQTKAAAWASSKGETLPPMPQGMNGATLTLKTNPVVIEGFTAASSDPQPFLVAQSPVPGLESTGPTVTEIEHYVANLPGIPSTVRQQLLTLGSPETTLPVPIPAGTAVSSPISVNGTAGLLVTATGGGLRAIAWQAGGMLHLVAGDASTADLLHVAASLN